MLCLFMDMIAVHTHFGVQVGFPKTVSSDEVIGSFATLNCQFNGPANCVKTHQVELAETPNQHTDFTWPEGERSLNVANCSGLIKACFIDGFENILHFNTQPLTSTTQIAHEKSLSGCEKRSEQVEHSSRAGNCPSGRPFVPDSYKKSDHTTNTTCQARKY